MNVAGVMGKVSQAVSRINTAAQAAIATTKANGAKVEKRQAAKLQKLKLAGRAEDGRRRGEVGLD